MSDTIKSIDQIDNMKQLRQTIDQLDSNLVSMIRERFACMDAAARIKQKRSNVRDEERKAEVLANVKRLAGDLGIPVPTVAAMWEILIETSISYELEKWDTLRGK